jgi:hypothetical protein
LLASSAFPSITQPCHGHETGCSSASTRIPPQWSSFRTLLVASACTPTLAPSPCPSTSIARCYLRRDSRPTPPSSPFPCPSIRWTPYNAHYVLIFPLACLGAPGLYLLSPPFICIEPLIFLSFRLPLLRSVRFSVLLSYLS